MGLRTYCFTLIAAGLLLARGAKAESFGSLAFDARSGAWGAAWNHNTSAGADAEALHRCGARGTGCITVVRFMGDCGSFSKGNGSAYGWATAATKELANMQSLRNCQETGAGCRVRVWACNSQGMHPIPQKAP